MSFYQVIEDLRAFGNECANKHLDRLVYQYSYTAPEIRQELFWLGDRNCLGITDICRSFFPENEDVFDLFMNTKCACEKGTFVYG